MTKNNADIKMTRMYAKVVYRIHWRSSLKDKDENIAFALTETVC